ncbi:MAG: cation:proton antiporter [Bacteroidetes bacterium]|jgi:multicomponent Na+:H+ antiporter subunit F|nr:cation:proton antiporter [Bacteroidota bacterium]
MTLNFYLTYILLPILIISVILIFIRFLKGPSIADRVIAIDLMVTCSIGIIAFVSIISHQPTFLDITMIIALIGFLSIVAFSYYLEKRNKND